MDRIRADKLSSGGSVMAKLTRRQRRRVILWAQYLLVVVVVLIIAFSADWTRLIDSFGQLDVAGDLFPDIITIALRNTLIFTISAFMFGLAFGLILALMRLSTVAPYRWAATAYIELFRGLPALLVLFMVAYGVPNAFPDREIPGGVYGQVAIGLGLTSAAYLGETIRGGIQAVPRGQIEAARSLGMSHFSTMRKIVLPQAMRIMIPPLTNEIIALTKDSSLAYILGVTAATIELTKFGSDALINSANATPLIVSGLCYLVITIPLSQVVHRLERRRKWSH